VCPWKEESAGGVGEGILRAEFNPEINQEITKSGRVYLLVARLSFLSQEVVEVQSVKSK
jgi:hypothetical protein